MPVKNREISAEARIHNWDPSGLGGTSTKIYTRPENYADKVRTVWNDYDADPTFQYLVDRMIHFGVNGTHWHMEDKSQEPFWNEWARRVNSGYIDIIPGLDEVEKWVFKNLGLSGMAALEWDRGKMSIGNKTYSVPTNITVYPATQIEIKNPEGTFGGNQAWLTEDGKNQRQLGTDKKRGAFLLKMNYSPADLASAGKMVVARAGGLNTKTILYPKPPFLTVHEDIETRLSLREVDRSTVADLINLIWHFKIGDKENPPKPPKKDKDGNVIEKGTVEIIADIIKNSDKTKSGGTRSIFLPYYIAIEKIIPDIQVLLNYNKYLAPTLNLLAAFGILVSPGSDSKLDFTEIDTQNFEQYLDFIRLRHIGRFIEGILCAEIVRENDGLKEIPSLRFNVLNTKTNEFRKYILELLDRGRMSNRIATEVAGLNFQHVLEDLKEETGIAKPKSDTELFNAAVTVRFKQGVVNEQPIIPAVKDKTGGG